jgi:O-antigen/teichoic acid export membrane protein
MVLLNLLIKPISIFGIDAAVQNRVGAEEYGVYFSLLNFSFLFNLLLDFGINNFTTKSVAQHPKVAIKYFGKVFTFRLLLFLVYAAVSYTIAFLLNWGTRELILLSFLVFNQFLVALIAYIRSHLGGLMLFRTEAIIGILDRALLILFCGMLLYGPMRSEPFQIEWFIWLQTICYGLTLIVGIITLFSRIGIPEFRYKPAFAIAIIRQSFPYALLILLMMIYTRMDSVMIERIHVNGKSEAGFYAQGLRLISALFLFAMLFSNLLFPMFSQLLKKGENVSELLNMSARLLIGGAIGLFIVTLFNSDHILALIYTNNIKESSLPFVLLMFSFIGMAASIVYGTLLTAKGDMKFLNYAAAAGIVINISLNLYLIPNYGALGAAIATVTTQCAVSLAQFIYSMQFLKLEIFNLRSLTLVGYTILSAVIFYYFRMESIMSTILIFACVPILMTLFGLIDLRQLKVLLKRAG